MKKRTSTIKKRMAVAEGETIPELEVSGPEAWKCCKCWILNDEDDLKCRKCGKIACKVCYKL